MPLNSGIVNINCFSDALEITLDSPHSRLDAENKLLEWFGDWYHQGEALIQLDLGDATLPIEFIEDKTNLPHKTVIKPFWNEMVYINSTGEESNVEKQLLQEDTVTTENNHETVPLPEAYSSSSKPLIVAFYSFKGGVGRTLQLAAHLFALIDHAKELRRTLEVLVIDADLEAPGLTYWDRLEGQQAAVSFINFLEVYHYSPLEIERSLELFVKEIKKSPKREGSSTFYFLPACLQDEELLDTPILPEQIARSLNHPWEFGTALYRLGEAMEVDYVLIDLRAGLSEISSPAIFDPRIQRFFVTTVTEQSISGTELVLKQIRQVAPTDYEVDSNKYSDPSIIFSLLTPEIKALPDFENALVRLRSAYIQSENDTVYSKRLEVKETDFAQELLNINGWQDARNRLASSSVMRIAKDWAINQLKSLSENGSEKIPQEAASASSEQVNKLKDICERYVFAESGQGESLLVTEPLRNLATTFGEDLPHVVSLGAKGSGKTFICVQLCRLKYWETFVQLALKTELPSNSKTYIFPFLQSETLIETAKQITEEARTNIWRDLNINSTQNIYPEYRDQIKEQLTNGNLTELDWSRFWICQLANALSIELKSNSTPTALLASLNQQLKIKEIRIVFLIDGLEDLFQNASHDSKQQIALKTLIELPQRLSELRQLNLGLLILLRRDFLRYALSQNVAQFESLYRPYELIWNLDSFLKLVYWVCSQANVIDAREAEIDALSREEIIEKLQRLWGEKLGGVKEAYSHNWVFAVLTDFKGRLQARDIVRFLFHAAKTTVEDSMGVLNKWSANRLLPPAAIRRAPEPCSLAKVQEAQEEYPDFKEWVESLGKFSQDLKQVPFSVEDLDMEPATIRMLEDMGVLYEDKAKREAKRFYMPEIFRTGLGFSLANRARPRVLVLKRKALEMGSGSR
jgi:cellulose biosynthesis protein BcsQ